MAECEVAGTSVDKVAMAHGINANGPGNTRSQNCRLLATPKASLIFRRSFE
jgi:hypothetical protein